MKFIRNVSILLISLLAVFSVQKSAFAETASIVTSEFTLVDSNGYPIIGGTYSWRSKFASSSKPKAGTALGSVTFSSVISDTSDPISLILNGGHTVDGLSVNDCRTTFVPKEGKNKITLEPLPNQVESEVQILLPNGVPVPGAQISGNLGEKSIYVSNPGQNCEFSDPTPNNYYADDSGVVRWKSWQSVGVKYKAAAWYEDGEISQHTAPSELIDGKATLTLLYMPVVQLTTDTIDASLNKLTSIDLSIVDPSLEPKGQAVQSPFGPATFGMASLFSPGTTAEIVAPSNALQSKCGKGTKLKGKPTAAGKIKLTFCASASGNYKIKTAGAVSAGSFRVRVKGAAPMAPESFTAVSLSPNKANLAWASPDFDGGSKIIGYQIYANAEGEQERAVLLTSTSSLFKSKSYTFANLNGKKVWHFKVAAKSAKGIGEYSGFDALVDGSTLPAIEPMGSLSISGGKVGSKITIKSSGWSSKVKFIYQWKRAGSDLPGEQNPFYKPSNSDIGSTISCKITAWQPGKTGISVVTNGLMIKK